MADKGLASGVCVQLLQFTSTDRYELLFSPYRPPYKASLCHDRQVVAIDGANAPHSERRSCPRWDDHFDFDATGHSSRRLQKHTDEPIFLWNVLCSILVNTHPNTPTRTDSLPVHARTLFSPKIFFFYFFKKTQKNLFQQHHTKRHTNHWMTLSSTCTMLFGEFHSTSLSILFLVLWAGPGAATKYLVEFSRQGPTVLVLSPDSFEFSAYKEAVWQCGAIKSQ